MHTALHHNPTHLSGNREGEAQTGGNQAVPGRRKPWEHYCMESKEAGKNLSSEAAMLELPFHLRLWYSTTGGCP